MRYIIYKTTNLLNGKFYTGAHKCESLDDGYLGSSRLLLRSIRAKGKENFFREVLQELDSEEAMYLAEKMWVTEELVRDPMSYNHNCGGQGGWAHIIERRRVDSEFDLRMKILFAEARKKSPGNKNSTRTQEWRRNMSRSQKGRKHSREHVNNMRRAKLGKIAVCEVESKINRFIEKEDLSRYLEMGWCRGYYKSYSGEPAMVSEEKRLQIDALDHVELCRLWRHAPTGHPLLQGDAGAYFKQRLDAAGGFTPAISKLIGW